MAFLHFDDVGIAALACAVPSFVQEIDTDPQGPRARYIRNFVKNMGITRRHVSVTEQTCTDLGHAAMLKALRRAGWEADSLDGLIFLSQMPDFNPGTGNAFVLHKHLGLRTDALAFDITLGCSSVPYGLSVAAALLAQPGIRRLALVIGDNAWSGAPTREHLLAQETFLFGEGTVALLLEHREAPGMDLSLHSDGSGYHHLYNPCVGYRNSWRRNSPTVRLPDGEVVWWYPNQGNFMDGTEITAFSTTTVVDSIKAFLGHIGRTPDSFDGIVLHQANAQIVRTIARQLGVDMAKVPLSLDRYGNTSGASALVTVADAYAGRAEDSLDLLLCAFGIGLSWGMASLKLAPAAVEPIFTCDDVRDEGFIESVPPPA